MSARAILNALISFAIIVTLALLVGGERSCQRRGGHYVRGLFWMECVR
jgi:hypothetical protein